MNNSFIINKYYKWYYNIIHAAQSCTQLRTEYSERHHIIPRSLGGDDSFENIVTLTAREHFICHVLLTKFTSGTDKHKMIYAANLMSQSAREYQHRYTPTSRIYEMLKKEFGEMHSKRLTGRKLSAEHRKKIAAAGKGRINSQETIEKRRQSCIGKTRTEEQRKRMSDAQKNRTTYIFSDEEKKIISEKISQALTGRVRSDEHRANASAALKGKNTGPKSEETKQKMRKPKSEAHRKAISEGRKAKFAALKENQSC